MAEFHETGYGKRYYEHQLPEIMTQLKRIADALDILSAPKPVKVKVPKAPKVKPMVKNAPGDYTLTIEGDIWHIYQDSYNIYKVWRAERKHSDHLTGNLKAKYKSEIVEAIYAIYKKP